MLQRIGCGHASSQLRAAAAKRSARRGQHQARTSAARTAAGTGESRCARCRPAGSRRRARAALPSRARRPSRALPCWPARSSSRVDGREHGLEPSVPDEAQSTMSTSGCVATATRPSRPPRQQPGAGRADARRLEPRRTPARRRAADSARPAPRTLDVRSRRQADHSQAVGDAHPRPRARSVPIDPVEPRMAMRFMR